MSDAEFYECQAAISTVLDNYKNSPKTHPPCLPTPKPFVRPNLVSRPSLYGDSELPAIEEVPCLELVGNKSERWDLITTTIHVCMHLQVLMHFIGFQFDLFNRSYNNQLKYHIEVDIWYRVVWAIFSMNGNLWHKIQDETCKYVYQVFF